jgi:hypothetical protein
MILGVHLEMVGEVADPLTEQGYLYLRGSGVIFMGLELSYDFIFLLRKQYHDLPPHKAKVRQFTVKIEFRSQESGVRSQNS